MEKRRLGATNFFVNPVGLGCMGFSHAYGAAIEKSAAIKTIREAYELGYNFFDTAECYTGENVDGSTSNNEELVGEALKDVRDKVVIATKFGVAHNPDRSLTLDSSPATIRKSVDGSLKRLGVETIDLYYQHRIDPKIEPETVAEVMSELIKAGKIRSWGISEANEEYLRRAHKICPVTAIQNRYSLMARWHEKLFPVLEELGITFVAFSPLANGLLSGAYTKAENFSESGDYRNMMPQFTASGIEKAKDLLALLQKLAAEKNSTPAQISLAWMISKKPYIVPIPGSRKLSRLKENFGTGEIFLSPNEIADIDAKLDTMNFEIFGGSPTK
ncbi:MAG: aldo/keto reductase [Selenomonadaceae bacterium]|nr:aldo/keto reductase [Selenomonadaceae bacterium]